MLAAELAGETARTSLAERCGAEDVSLSFPAEGIGTIGRQLQTALACIDALEKRVRELEASKA